MGFDDLEKYGKTSENSARTRKPSYFKRKLDDALYGVDDFNKNKKEDNHEA